MQMIISGASNRLLARLVLLSALLTAAGCEPSAFVRITIYTPDSQAKEVVVAAQDLLSRHEFDLLESRQARILDGSPVIHHYRSTQFPRLLAAVWFDELEGRVVTSLLEEGIRGGWPPRRFSEPSKDVLRPLIAEASENFSDRKITVRKMGL